MPNKHHKTRPKFRRNLVILYLPVALFVIFGYLAIRLSHAATFSVAVEAENGNKSGNASTVSNTPTASGNASVKFGTTSTPSGTLTAADLQRISQLKIFFGHQSVGANILEGIPLVFDSLSVQRPNIIDSGAAGSTSGGYIAQAYIGQNEHPDLKNSDFDSKIRGGLGSIVKVAFYKYCFVDLYSNANVQSMFNAYKTTMDALARDYPNVVFLYATNPLTVQDTADNIAREQYNNLVRQAYGSTGRLFDIAKAESTKPDGSRTGGTSSGAQYYQLYDGYSSDGGHLNTAGEQAIAKYLLTVISDATR